MRVLAKLSAPPPAAPFETAVWNFIFNQNESFLVQLTTYPDIVDIATRYDNSLMTTESRQTQ